MRPITLSEIRPLQKPVQHFSDCYLVSSVGALARSKEGQKILSQNIAHCKDGFRIRFQNINDFIEDYIVTAENIKKLIPLDRFYNEQILKYPAHPIIRAIEFAMGEMLRIHPDKKPLVCRLKPCHERFEYNKPSNFLELFTGEKPITLNEDGIKMSLTKHKDKAIELFEKIDKANQFSFVAGTGLISREGLTTIHCYTVEGVNKDNRYIQFLDCRLQKSTQLTFDRAIKAFKFLTGFLY